jgi:hypothetical protein
MNGGQIAMPLVSFSDIDPRGLLLNPTDSVMVTLKVNLGPAKRYADAFVPGLDTVKIVFQDALWRSAQVRAQGAFPQVQLMSLDPTGGDSVYQITFKVKGPTHYNMQYTYRYTHPGGNEVNQGGGLGGQNPFITRFILPTAPNAFPASYTAPTDVWKHDRPLPGEPAPFPTSVDGTEELPTGFALSQNYPNPFNPSTSIRYSLPIQSKVTLKVFNVLGQEVLTLVNDVQTAGEHIVAFEPRTLASGAYFYRIEAGGFVDVKRMMLLK